MSTEYYDELKVILLDASKHGAECYIYCDKKGDFLWGKILTEKVNVLYIQRDSFKWRGWTFSLRYKPSKKNGSGCECFEEPLQEVSYDDILRAEMEGLEFARKLGATLYTDGRKELESSYRFDYMERVV